MSFVELCTGPHESLGSCPAQNFTIVDHQSMDDVGQFGIDWIADKDLVGV